MIDLKFNYPSVPTEMDLIKQYFTNDFVNEQKDFLLFPPFHGDKNTIDLGASWLGLSSELFPDIVDIVMCNSGNQALLCLLQACRKQYDSIITEPFTYVSFKSIALENNYQLISCEVDNEGITIEGLDAIVKSTGSKLLYIQPTIQNPTCVVMPIERRRQIAEYAKEHNLLIIEDDAYRFMCVNPPLRFLDLLPEQTIHIYSLSKPFNPLIKTAFVALPKYLKTNVADYIRMSSSGNSSLLSGLTSYLLQTNALQTIIEQKQALAERLQNMVTPLLEGLTYRTNPTCSHIWITLPTGINSTRLVNDMASKQIIITSGNEFAIDESIDGEKYIRIALGGEKNTERLTNAVRVLVATIKELEIN